MSSEETKCVKSSLILNRNFVTNNPAAEKTHSDT